MKCFVNEIPHIRIQKISEGFTLLKNSLLNIIFVYVSYYHRVTAVKVLQTEYFSCLQYKLMPFHIITITIKT